MLEIRVNLWLNPDIKRTRQPLTEVRHLYRSQIVIGSEEANDGSRCEVKMKGSVTGK